MQTCQRPHRDVEYAREARRPSGLLTHPAIIAASRYGIQALRTDCAHRFDHVQFPPLRGRPHEGRGPSRHPPIKEQLIVTKSLDIDILSVIVS